jgi:hypothetical protein
VTAAAVTFLPWLRRGLAASIARGDDTAGGAAPATFAVGMSFNSAAQTATANLPLLGAGDVVGVDPRAVIRVWPRPGVYDAAANYFPILELAQPDLPWRYTPAAASPKDRLRPWICLAALKADEFERSPEPPGATRPVVTISVKASAALPNLAQSWAWAYVQVSAAAGVGAAQLQNLFVSDPTRLIAGLICPRRLEPKTHYTVFLVPTFDRGRRAGTGGDPESAAWDTPAWSGARTSDLELPVYYEWEFTSGDAEDFEALVRKLKKTAITQGGARDMDVSAPGLGLPAAAGTPLGLEGALRAPSVSRTAWSAAEQGAWTTALKVVVDDPQAGARLAPPLYGRWHAARAALQPPVNGVWPSWFDEINGDPRWRVVAAIGGFVVQRQQDQLMASAWTQASRIREINAELRHAQAAREIARRVHLRHLDVDDPETVILLAGPVHTRIKVTAGDPFTIPRTLQRSTLRPGVLASQMRRLRRRMGPIGRRLGLLTNVALPSLLRRLNDGEIVLARQPRIPAGLVRMFRLVPTAPVASAPGGRPAFGAREYTGETVEGWDVAPPTPKDVNTGPDSASAAAFRDAVAAGWPSLSAADPLPSPLAKVDLAALRARLVDQLNPDVTIAEIYQRRVAAVKPGTRWQPETLGPIMAAPSFASPMFEPLRELSQEWIFPGLDKVPANSVSVLEMNRRFISAYMVGLNHEMARELLWHGFPTDQRGTYFRQFWDPASYFPAPGATLTPGQLEDIDPITSWPAAAALDTAGKQTALPNGRLVLLIRGDLLRRYPNATLYAAKAERIDPAASVKVLSQPDRRQPTSDPTREMQPLFSGSLKPDVSYFAFDLTADQALGRVRGHEGGWYFVLQEQPSEPRFGFDVSAGASYNSWDDLAWDRLGGSVGNGYVDIDVHAPPAPAAPGAVVWPTTAGTGTAADLAFITFQSQVRVAVHASDLIEP